MDDKNCMPNAGKITGTPFTELPLGAVKPAGWLYNQLLIQSRGLTGHLDEIWDSVGSYSGWLGGTGENWERGPYYCDGLIPLAYLLEDEKLIGKAEKWIEWTLNSQSTDGFFGPRNNDDWWPRMVMLKALIQYREATGDDRVPDFMTRYFRCQKEKLPERPLQNWGRARGGENLYCIYWLYRMTGDEFLLDLFDIISRQTMDWSEIFSEFPFTRPTGFYYKWDNVSKISWVELDQAIQYHATHVVNVAMAIKTPALLYMLNGDTRHRDAVYRGIENLTRYHGHVAGIFTGDEHLNGRNPSQGTELCAVAEYMFSLQILSRILGDTVFADVLEKVACNALPAAFTRDMRGHQYDQQPNQVLVTKARRKWYNNGDYANIFGLEPNFGCCAANMHQGWPKYVGSLWSATGENGLAAMVYAPCSVRKLISGSTEVVIKEETDYPFGDIIKFDISCREKAKFPLKLRIPGWCEKASIRINGSTVCNPAKNSCITLDREWSGGDRIELEVPMDLRVSKWYNNSAGIEYGPLVFALKIGEEWKKLRGNDPYADWEVYPKTPWNYALILDCDNPCSSFSIEKGNIAFQPFDSGNSPVVLKGKGRRLDGWKLEDNSAGELPASPVCSGNQDEEIELVPYGGAKLRVSEFPYIEE